ncbi:MAG: hypothetical protein AB1486_15425 [Planctomycetota bacterium]
MSSSQLAILVSTCCCCFSPAVTAQESGEPITPLAAGVVAEVNGRSISEDDYKQWLYARWGRFYLTEYLDQVLLLEAAAAEGVIITEEEVERAFQKEWAEYVERRFRGDESLYLRELERGGRTFQDHRAERLFLIRLDLITEELVRLRRDPNDEELQKLFQMEYGAEGFRRHLRVAYFDKFPSYKDPSQERPTPDDFRRVQDEAARRAQEFLEAVRGGADFTTMVRERSDDNLVPTALDPSVNYKERGGEIEHCKFNMLGREVEMALQKLGDHPQPGAITDVIDGRRGLYVIQVVEIAKVAFEQERPRLMAFYLQRQAQPGEKHLLRQSLREKARILKRQDFGDPTLAVPR